MTPEEAFNHPEMKIILLLSGYARELGEGQDFEKITYKTAESIVKLFAKPICESVCVNCDEKKETNSICPDCLTKIINENK